MRMSIPASGSAAVSRAVALALAVLAAPALADECAAYREALDAVPAFDVPFPEPDRITPAFRAVVATTEPSLAALTAIGTTLDAAKAAKTLYETLAVSPVLKSGVAAVPTDLARAIRLIDRALETRQRTMIAFHETIFLAHCTGP